MERGPRGELGALWGLLWLFERGSEDSAGVESRGMVVQDVVVSGDGGGLKSEMGWCYPCEGVADNTGVHLLAGLSEGCIIGVRWPEARVVVALSPAR